MPHDRFHSRLLKQSKTYEYVGESEHWHIVFTHKVDDLKNVNDLTANEIALAFKGDLAAVTDDIFIDYTYEIGSETWTNTIDFQAIDTQLKVIDESKGDSVLQGHETGIFTITWNGQSERIEVSR